MTPTELQNAIQFVARNRRQPADAPEIIVERDARSDAMRVRVIRRVYLGFKPTVVGSQFSISERALVEMGGREFGDLILERVDTANAHLDLLELNRHELGAARRMVRR